MVSCIGLLGVVFASTAAAAQDAPTAAVFRTQAPPEMGDRSGALDRVLRSALDDIDVIQISGTLALDLEQAQLGLGCMAESAECFGSMAEQNEVQILIAPRLEQSGDEVVLTLLRFDGRDDSLRQVTRRLPDESAALLDSVRPVVRELFGLPDLQEDPGDGDGSDGDMTTPETPPADDGIGLGGPLLLGIGGAALLGGVVAGVLFKGSQSDYEDIEVTRDNVDEANDHLAAATLRGRAATALFIAGGVVATAGVVWLLVDLLGGGDEPSAEPSARLRPMFAAGRDTFEAGLILEGEL